MNQVMKKATEELAAQTTGDAPQAIAEQKVELNIDASDNKLLKIGVVAEWLDVSEQRLYEMVRQDLIPHTKMGRNIRFDRAAIAEWIKGGGTPLPGGWRKERGQ